MSNQGEVINVLLSLGNIINYIFEMQIPPSLPYHQSTSIFQVILQEYSSHDLSVDLQEIKEMPQACQVCHLEAAQKAEQTSQLWLTIHDEPEEPLIVLNVDGKDEQISSQITKVRTLRQSQELKLKQLLQSTQAKSIKRIYCEDQGDNSSGKTAKSLSPKKTKRIDKRSFRLLSEDV